MPSYKETRQLAAADAAYIAGLIDGEGTITLSRRHARDRRQLVVSIANTERPLLDFVLARVGAGKITRKRISAAHHVPSYCYSISNRQALALVGQLRPYLRSHKRDRSVIDSLELFASDAEEWQIHGCDGAGSTDFRTEVLRHHLYRIAPY